MIKRPQQTEFSTDNVRDHELATVILIAGPPILGLWLDRIPWHWLATETAITGEAHPQVGNITRTTMQIARLFVQIDGRALFNKRKIWFNKDSFGFKPIFIVLLIISGNGFKP